MANIPSDAVVYNGHSYKLFDNGMTWDEAKAYCEKLGGHLVTITDENEQAFIENLLSEKGSKNSYWLGGYKNDNGDWQWVTNEEFEYTNWLKGQPDNFTGKENGIMAYKNDNPLVKLSFSHLGWWNDVNFDGTCKNEEFFGTENFGFICEWDNSWTLSGTTAKYGNLVTVKGVKSTEGLSVNDKVVTVANSALNKKKVTVNNGYTLALADDVTKTVTKKAAWTLKNSTATYKSSYKTAGYTLASNKKSISYSKATTAETLATIKGVKSKSGLKVSGQKITLKNSALNKKVTVSGGYEFDFASDYSKATITGSKSSDTITTRGKKISINGGACDDVIKIFGSGTVTGGDGADIFYYKSSGANVISDYEEEDKISLASGNANVTISGDDVIFNDKITIKGGADKTITYIENDIEKTFRNSADDVIYNAKGTAATLTAEYTAESFTPSDYIKYKDILVTINAADVTNPLEILGNRKANVIIGSGEDDFINGDLGADKIEGGDGNDTLVGGKGNDKIYGGDGDDSLWGGAGTDTLFGDDGSDIFVYKSGDGKMIIDDFDDSWDKIRVLSGEVKNPYSTGADVTFEVGGGQIVIKNGANKFIPIYYGKGNSNIVQKYNGK